MEQIIGGREHSGNCAAQSWRRDTISYEVGLPDREREKDRERCNKSNLNVTKLIKLAYVLDPTVQDAGKGS